ncbi:MAG: exonuclease SbcCD subunit D [Chloroflexi bacterium]|nr:exonuclease SbcCD subunit D [Chloroflexota bacterium]
MEPIKLLHTADIHIGMENYGRVDPATGINARVMDFLRRLSDIGDYAVEQGVDVFVFAGDAYKTRDPNPTYQREFARRIKRIADAGIPVVMLVGNHDLPAVAKRATSIDIFGTLDVPNVIVGNREELTQIVCRCGQPLQVATAPYPLRSALVSREDQQGKSLTELDTLLQNTMIENLQALATQARQRPDVPAILVGHFSVNEASHGSEQNIMIGRDAALPRSVLADPTWRYVALGHIHKHQSLNGEFQPPVLYSGSIERIDFGEEHEPKGFVVAEIGDGPTTWEFVRGYKRQARSFVTVKADVRDVADPTAAVVAAIKSRGDLSETVVRVVVKLRQEQEALLVEREITRALEAAYFVAALQKDVERTERQRLGAVSVEALTPAELLARYLQVKEVPEERAKLLQQHGEALIGAVDGATALP